MVNRIAGQLSRKPLACCECLEQRVLLSAAVQGTAWIDFDCDHLRDASDTPLKNLTVYSDENGNGLLDQTAQTAYTYFFRTMDGGNMMIDSQAVASSYRKIVDLNVKVNVGAMSTQPVTLYLVSPSGTRVLLAENVGQGMRGGFRNVIFDDQAANPVSYITSAPGGAFQPSGPLSAVIGEDPNGAWTLEIGDSSSDTSATVLYSWSLTFTFGEMSTVTAADGTYTLDHLDAGARMIRQSPGVNWAPTVPDGGVYRLTLVDNQTTPNVDFSAYPTPGQIRGTKWLDSNANGIRDLTEPGLPGWTIYIDINENHQLDAGEPSAVTDSTGNYVLTNVPTGVHTIAEVEQPLWQRTRPGGTADRLYILGGDGTIRELNGADYTVLRAFRPPEVVSGMAIGNKSLFVLAASGVLWELNPDTGAVIDRDPLPNAAAGSEIAYLNNRLYFTSPADNSVQVWNPDTDVVEASWTLDQHLSGMTGAADRGLLYGTAPGGIVAIDPNTGAVVNQTGYVPMLAGGLAYQNGHLIVIWSATTLSRVNPETGLIESQALINAGVSEITAVGGDGAVNRVVYLAPAQMLVKIDFGGQPVTPTPASIDLPAGCDTGMFSDDNITRMNNADSSSTLQITVTGTVVGATVWLYADGVNLVGSAVATSDTMTFTMDGVSAMADGTHTFIARQQLPGEAMSAFATKLEVTIDTQAPLTPVAPDLQTASDNGPSSTDNVTNDNTPTFDIPQGPYFRLYRDGVLISDPYATGQTYTESMLPDGTYHYTMQALDAAGNISGMSQSVTITIDTAVPQITNFTAASTLDGMFLSIQLSKDLDPMSLAGMLRLQGPSGRDVDLSLASFRYDPLTRTAVWDVSSVSLTNGRYTARFATATVQDLAGNVLNGGTEYLGTFSRIRQTPKGKNTGTFNLLASVNPLTLAK